MGRAPGVCAEIQPNFPAATPTMQPLPNISVLLPSKTHSRSLSPIEEPESQEMSFEEAGYTPVIAVPYSPGDFEYLISSLKGFSEPFEPYFLPDKESAGPTAAEVDHAAEVLSAVQGTAFAEVLMGASSNVIDIDVLQVTAPEGCECSRLTPTHMPTYTPSTPYTRIATVLITMEARLVKQ